MFGLRIDSPPKLTKILEPFRDFFDSCWWYLDGHGATLPNPKNAPPPTPLQYESADSVERWKAENAFWLSQMKKQQEEYALWVDDSEKNHVGILGWYSRYMDYADTDWAIYYACHNTQNLTPQATLQWLGAFECPQNIWSSDPANWLLPDEVVTVCRNIDNAYWDVFFRDPSWKITIQNHLRHLENAQFSDFRVIE